jgi:NAD(P)-dependent dehydrogenase (short-subunit alcohol dehydrogenase family)
MDLELNGKVAIVTGGAGGIGRAIVLALAQEGARVAVVDRNHGAALQQTADAIAGLGAEAITITADVSDDGAVQAMVREVVERVGQADILVNNAGIVSRKVLLDVSLEEWDAVLRTNLYGCFHCTRAVAHHLIERNAPGRIVNISSIHGRVAKAAMGSYCASKAAIDMLTKQAAVELAPAGIIVNAVAPGTISTEINIPLYRSTAPADVALRTATLKRVPMGRLGEADEIARMVTFLCSAASGYVTGTITYVDGGYTAEGTPRM